MVINIISNYYIFIDNLFFFVEQLEKPIVLITYTTGNFNPLRHGEFYVKQKKNKNKKLR